MTLEAQSAAGGPATELAALLDAATSALARFDAEQLERLGARALELQALRSLDGVAAGEAAARLRVFASVLRATGSGLDVLRRVSASHSQPSLEPRASRPHHQRWEPFAPTPRQPAPSRQV